MQNRTLVQGGSSSGVEIAPIVLGGNVFGWTIDEAKSFEILDAFVDRGFNMIDTADVYSKWVPGHTGGESETIIGKWFARSGKRDKVVLATKVGMDMGDAGKGLSASHISKSVDRSLKRLQTDRIDLYQSHQDDQSIPLEETLSAYEELVKAGKVRFIGASNYTGARLTEAMQTAKDSNLPQYVTLQPEYNLHAREKYETDLAPVAAKYGLGVIPYFSLAAGFLTGKYKSKDDAKGVKREGAVSKYFDARGERILPALEKVANEAGSTQASVALAWLLSKPNIAGPIASATSLQQLESLFAAAELRLTADQLKQLEDGSAY